MLLLRLSTEKFNAFVPFVVQYTDLLTINSKAVEKYNPKWKWTLLFIAILFKNVLFFKV